MSMIRKMKDKDKLFLVVYIGIKACSDQAAINLVEAVKKQITRNEFDNTVTIFCIPTRKNNEIKIECINPVLLDKEQYKRVEDSIKKIENVINNYDKENI